MLLGQLDLFSQTLQKDELRLSAALRQAMEATGRPSRLLVVCVGTPRNAGDSLGPMAGTLLERRLTGWRAGALPVEVAGTLSDPIHAMNLAERAQGLRRPDTFVLAVDASVGKPGEVLLRSGPLAPGAGLGRDLPPVGDVHLLCGVAPLAMGFWCAHMGHVLGMAEAVGRVVVGAALGIRMVS